MGVKYDPLLGQLRTSDASAGGGGTTVYFSAYRTTAQNLTGGDFRQINWNATEFDNSSNFDTNTNAFIAPSSGLYWFHSNVSNNGENFRKWIHLYKNGSSIKAGLDTANYPLLQAISVTAILSLSSGDSIDVRMFVSGTVGVVNGITNSYFQGYKIV